jgi:hypothetical protein
VLETRKPAGELFRLGRKPDPWQPPDWSRANPDGTFGNRFDDPQGRYRVLYASTQRVCCFVETLARFRPSLTLLAELAQIDGEDDFFPMGKVPRDWCDRRLLGVASADVEHADIYASGWIALLRTKLADECLRLGLVDLDAGVLQVAPRRITQLASRQAFERTYPGIYYRSRYGHDFDNWAIFEPFPIISVSSAAIAAGDADLTEALKILRVELSGT